MPESISASIHPVGIVIAPGASWTVATRLWTLVWSVQRESDWNTWPLRGPNDRTTP